MPQAHTPHSDDATATAEQSNGGRAAPAPDVAESLREFKATGRAGLRAGKDVAKAFQALLGADLALARGAFGRTLALSGLAIVFGASACVLLMAALMVFLTTLFGLSWPVSLLLCGLLSSAIAGVAAWQARRYFAHTRLRATRRYLERVGNNALTSLKPGPEHADRPPAGTADSRQPETAPPTR